MKRILAVLMMAGLVISFAGTSFAAQKKSAVTGLNIKGVVVSTDTAANTLIVKHAKTKFVVAVNHKTVIRSGKKAETLADIKSGETVNVRYTKTHGKYIAKYISMLSLKK
jgi:hypothetical protein